MSAVDQGQSLRDEGKLGEAREKFITCTAKSCPGVITRQCSDWLAEVERDLPSLMFRARDERGKEILNVRVYVDGTKVADAIDAKPLTFDPREHVIKIERADGTSVEDKVLLRVGEKNRVVDLSFAKAPPVGIVQEHPLVTKGDGKPAAGGFHVPLLGWVGAGVFVAGGATATVLAIMANGEESDLRSTCAPKCDPGQRDGIESKILIANIAAAVGLVGLGVAIVTTVIASSSSTSDTAKRRPTPGLAFTPAGISATF